MSRLTRLALRRPLTVYVLMAIVVFGGLAAYRGLPRESFPEIRIPLIFVSVVYPGASPLDVESQVTRKIETELKGVSGLKEVRSTSYDGFALIEAEFNPDVNLDTALQKVREKVDQAQSELPRDAEDPVVTDVDFSRIPIMVISLAADFGMDRLKSLADDLEDELESIPGVNLVTLVGGRDREVQVFADPRRLAAYELGLLDLVDTIAREHVNLPGGELEIGRQKFLVRTAEEVEDPMEILEFVVDSRDGRPIRVRDVATVVYGFQDESTRSRLNGRTAVSLTVEKRTGANILEVADRVRSVVESTAGRLPPTAEIVIVTDQSIDIDDMNRDLENNILSGLALVLIVLFLALGWRPAVIVSAAIPFSMLLTFLAVSLMGHTLNMVILFSLVLLLGMLVDNAIVTVENIHRHREIGDSPLDAAGNGASEVAMPIVASTATTLCAFAPMLLWPGIIGEFMSYLPMTLIIGLSASLFVALVFNPALALTLFRKVPGGTAARGADSAFARRYARVLAWCLDDGPATPFKGVRNWLLPGMFFGGLVVFIAVGLGAMATGATPPSVVLAAVAVISALAFGLHWLLWLLSLPVAFLTGRRAWVTDHRSAVLWSVATILVGTVLAYGYLGHGQEFFPETDPREIWVDLEFPSGTNLDAQDALMQTLEDALVDTPDLTDRIANVGSTGLSQDPGGGTQGATNESRLTLRLRRFHERAQSSIDTLAWVREQVGAPSGVRVKVDKMEDGLPTGKPVSVQLTGEDYDDLGRVATALRDRMDRVPGLLNVTDDHDVGLPEFRVVVDRVAAARANTSTMGLATTIRTALAGTDVAVFRDGEDEYDIVVRLPRASRINPDDVEELIVMDDDGRPVPLRSLARFDTSAGPAAIRRLDLKRTITVEADVDYPAGFRDADRRAAVAEILEGDLAMPAGVRWAFAGSNEEEAESIAFLSNAFVVAILLIALILVTEFDSLVTPLTILVAVLLSLIGVLWGLILTATPFGIIMTGIGVISLAGIVVNNAIVLCDFILQERRRGRSRHEAIVEAGRVRLRPVLLTAVTTVLGLIPLTLGISFDFARLTLDVGSESSQWWGPMGVAVICGLTVSTVLTLLVVPVAYDVLEGFREHVGNI